MRKNKVLILILMMFMMCGCTAEVNLNINDKYVSEEVIINATTDNVVTKDVLKGNFRKYMPAYNDVIVPDTEPDVQVSGVKYYNQLETENDYGYIFNYSYTFPIDEYNNARSMRRTFKSSSLEKDDKEKTLTLYTDKNGVVLMRDYSNFTDLKVNIKTSYEVIENNADSVIDGVYTWYFSQSNNNKNIYLKMSTETKKTEKKENNSTNNTIGTNEEPKEDSFWDKYVIFLIPGCIIGFILFVIIISKITRAKYDR